MEPNPCTNTSRKFLPKLLRRRKRKQSREQGNKSVCFCCMTALKPIFPHHIIPTNEGGADISHNLVYLCEPCHNEGSGLGSWKRIFDLKSQYKKRELTRPSEKPDSEESELAPEMCQCPDNQCKNHLGHWSCGKQTTKKFYIYGSLIGFCDDCRSDSIFTKEFIRFWFEPEHSTYKSMKTKVDTMGQKSVKNEQVLCNQQNPKTGNTIPLPEKKSPYKHRQTSLRHSSLCRDLIREPFSKGEWEDIREVQIQLANLKTEINNPVVVCQNSLEEITKEK